ncbi:MAG: DUF962 domain-containing protein [Gammaproteobacteria bacterium]|nr:MAG: DUF962 domain-containing protein [Gammaproteobacteria bacterium]
MNEALRVQYWLDEYAKDHQHPLNQRLHKICVPLIVLSLVGLLWAIPVPAAFAEISPALNWATAFLLAALVYYFILSIPLALGMAPLVLLTVLIVDRLALLPWPVWATSAVIFVLAWVGQFYGHAVEGRKPAFFRDLQFLMIGPLWVLAAAYRRLGIPY